ncbi:hypothetical protein DMB65_00290 [Flavobacterium cheongpyeongense]|jgi:hypothetical protein|uniref:Uncharacterized protein n=1 Tax=Flavobacterium cheongpyeongense TaxID=2212651 RepID=A0A2V4BV60_9FLAO|nr:hypothetical protein [Flavobacterium cheongpyeongense]PXY42502.1 hypothetical protein DMB65_00290 [Flavobacterium cheongpyeongense]
MKNFKIAIFTTAFILCCLTNVKAQDCKNVKEKIAKSNPTSELKLISETQSQAAASLDRRRLKTKHDTAKNSISNVR